MSHFFARSLPPPDIRVLLPTPIEEKEKETDSVFLFCYAATQLALQVQHERTRGQSWVSPEAPGSKALPQWTFNLEAYAHTCEQTKEKQNKTHIHEHATWMDTTHPGQQLIFYFDVFVEFFFNIFHCLF